MMARRHAQDRRAAAQVPHVVMAWTPFVDRGQVPAVGAEPDRDDPDPEPRQEGDLPVVRDPADAQMTPMDSGVLMVIGGRAGRVVLQRRIETIARGPAGIPGPDLTGFQVDER